MTSSETTSAAPADALPVRGDLEMLYLGSRMPRYTGYAAIHGNRNGLIQVADLPAFPSDETTWPAWAAKVHKILGDRGVLAAFGRHLIETTVAADCPWWCQEEHGLVVAEADLIGILHERPVATITFDGADTLNRGKTVPVSVQSITDFSEPDEPMGISVHNVPTELSVSDAVELIGALQKAVDLARTIQEADRDAAVSPVGDSAAQVMAEQDAVADDGGQA